MRKKFQIFISSTYEDLKKEREKVVATILKSYHFPIGMEMFSADNVEQWEQIRRTIDSSDYYILIIKRRYGSMTKEGISFTEKEYNYAREQGIPVLSFIAGKNAAIENSDIEDDPEKFALLNKFIERIKKSGYPCDFWNNADELCTLVNQALQKQFENNERTGWVRSDTVDERTDIKTLNENILLQNGKDVKYELARRNGDIRLAYDFIDKFDERLISSIRKKTYIDNFNREIVLDIDEDRLNVAITTRIQYMNVKADIIYYNANPRFETLKQAQSYKHEEFSVNGIDYMNEIVSNIECTNDKRQFPYIVRNTFPEKYTDNMILVHKTSHIVPVNQFFHVYQLVFPCRSFLTTVIIKNNPYGRYRLRTSTFSSYNVHMYENYTPEYRKDDISTITISQWALPGAGYTIVLQDMGLSDRERIERQKSVVSAVKDKYDAELAELDRELDRQLIRDHEFSWYHLITLQRGCKATCVVILTDDIKKLEPRTVLPNCEFFELRSFFQVKGIEMYDGFNEEALKTDEENYYLIIEGIDRFNDEEQEIIYQIVKDREYRTYYLLENVIIVLTVENKEGVKNIPVRLYNLCVVDI